MTQFIDCPATIDGEGYINENHSACGLPAEIESRYAVMSTQGVLACIKIRCPRGHWFNGSVDSLRIDYSTEEG